LLFENSREGFRQLVERLRELAPLEHYFILLERTGHYHRPVAAVFARVGSAGLCHPCAKPPRRDAQD
jgi:transposase